MSSAYVGLELQSEFGRIPPSFLPLGNKRLFQHQIKLAPQGSKIYLTIPETYDILHNDLIWLKKNDVQLIKLPDDLTLGEATVASLNLIEDHYDYLSILFGDTLFKSLIDEMDAFSISEIESHYQWAFAKEISNKPFLNDKGSPEDGFKKVASGYFNFSKPRHLVKCITKQRWDFIKGVKEYNTVNPLQGIVVDDWLDFGHVNTYYESKANFTTQRAFNELKITSDYIEKKSGHNTKIIAESNWFTHLPYELRKYTPQFLGKDKKDGKTSYKLEYLHHTPLNELFIFSNLPNYIWSKILFQCISFLKDCQYNTIQPETPYNKLSDLLFRKTHARIYEYCNIRGISQDEKWHYHDISKSLNEVIAEISKYIPNDSYISVLHGDFCFSNILYSFRSNRIKVIDPRGITLDGNISIYGDFRYDIAKLSHSIIGMYDAIISGYHTTNIENNIIDFQLPISAIQKKIQKSFITLISDHFQVNIKTLYAMQIHLFLSMLPLHCDDLEREKALFANAFRLYNLLKEEEKKENDCNTYGRRKLEIF